MPPVTILGHRRAKAVGDREVLTPSVTSYAITVTSILCLRCLGIRTDAFSALDRIAESPIWQARTPYTHSPPIENPEHNARH